MRIAWCIVMALVSIGRAQEDAAWLAWSGVGEAAGSARALGRSQPAALAWEGTTTVALSVIPAIYGMEGLRSGGAGFLAGRHGLGYGLSMSALEGGAVGLVKMCGSLGMQVVPGMAIGLGGAVGQWSFPRYAPRLEWEGKVGVQLKSNQLTTGALVTAWGQEGRPFSPERLRIIIGGAVALSESVTALAEALDQDGLGVQAGTRIAVIEAVSIILSWSDGSNCVGGACEITLDTWQLLAAARWHPILGWTRGIMLSALW